MCRGKLDRWFDKFTEWKIGDGRHTRLGEDIWNGVESFQNAFARLFLNLEQKGEVIENVSR